MRREPSTARALAAPALLALTFATGLPAPGAAQDAPPTSVHGTVMVRPEDGGGVLAGAEVALRDASGRTFRGVTDERGTYRVEGLPPGTVEITVTRIGFHPHEMEVRLPPGGDLALDVELVARPITLARLVIRGSPDPERPPGRADSSAVTAADRRASVSMRVLNATPGLAEVLPGGGMPGPDGSSPTVAGVYARSARADPGLVLLDGAPVQTPFSLTGLLPNLDTAIFRRVREHEGGAAARYDGGLSQVLEFRTRRPGSELRSQALLDGMTAGGSLEGRLWAGARFLLSGRALHDLGTGLTGDDPMPVGYGEGLLRLESAVGGSTLALTAFRNRERSRLDTALPDSPAPGSGLPDGAEATWGNSLLVTRWRGRPGGVDTRVVASWSRYQAGISPSSSADSRTDRGRASIELATPGLPGVRATGVTADWIRHRVGPTDDPARTDGGTATNVTVGGFLEGRWEAGPLTLDWGARVDRFSAGGTRAAVRSRLQWSPAETGTVVSLGVGRFHQVGADFGDGPAFDLVIPAEPEVLPEQEAGTGGVGMRVATADHVVAGLEQRITGGVALATRLHFKAYRDLPGPGSDRAASSGADIRLGWAGAGRSLGIGYALTWTWEQEGDAPRFDERHLLTARGRTPLPGPLELRAALSWGDGLPLSSIRLDPPAEPEEPGGNPFPPPLEDDFLRLDAELSALWVRDTGSRELRFRPYLRVLNGLASRDNLFRYFGPGGSGEDGDLAGRSILPVLGLEVVF